MFAGCSNTDMIWLIMEVKGWVNSKMMKKGSATYKHFDDSGKLLLWVKDPVTKEEIIKPISISHYPIWSI